MKKLYLIISVVVIFSSLCSCVTPTKLSIAEQSAMAAMVNLNIEPVGSGLERVCIQADCYEVYPIQNFKMSFPPYIGVYIMNDTTTTTGVGSLNGERHRINKTDRTRYTIFSQKDYMKVIYQDGDSVRINKDFTFEVNVKDKEQKRIMYQMMLMLKELMEEFRDKPLNTGDKYNISTTMFGLKTNIHSTIHGVVFIDGERYLYSSGEARFKGYVKDIKIDINLETEEFMSTISADSISIGEIRGSIGPANIKFKTTKHSVGTEIDSPKDK